MYEPFTINTEEAVRIVDNLELYVAPLVNPDGRALQPQHRGDRAGLASGVG
jgi:murein tripeptide amidase MpaA